MFDSKVERVNPWDEFPAEHAEMTARLVRQAEEKQASDPKAALMSKIILELSGRNLNQSQIGELLGVSRTRANNLMNGKASMFSLDALVIFAQRLNWRVMLTTQESAEDQHEAEFAPA